MLYFHIRTVHYDIIKVFYSPTNAQVIVLKTILKFTLIKVTLSSLLPNSATYTHQQGHYQYMQPHHHRLNHTQMNHN